MIGDGRHNLTMKKLEIIEDLKDNISTLKFQLMYAELALKKQHDDQSKMNRTYLKIIKNLTSPKEEEEEYKNFI